MKVLISKLEQGYDDKVNKYFFKAGKEVAVEDKVADMLLVSYPDMFTLVGEPTIEVVEEVKKIEVKKELPKYEEKPVVKADKLKKIFDKTNYSETNLLQMKNGVLVDIYTANTGESISVVTKKTILVAKILEAQKG